MGLEEYRGRGWRVNTAGYHSVCLCVFLPQAQRVTINQVLMYFQVFKVRSSFILIICSLKMIILKMLFRALGTFHCLGREINFTLGVCLSVVQLLRGCLNAVLSPWQ